jgi:NAD+ synthase (glutamine-hydrolysing)
MIHAGAAAAKLQAAGGVRSLAFDATTPLQLSSGETLAPLTIAFETYGALNAERSNAVLVCHSLTSDQFVASPNPITGRPAWWPRIVGPGRPIDTNRFFVVCSNVLGGSMGSTGPGTIAPELSDEASVYSALVLGVRDYVGKHGFPGVVMGLSGGIDSALTLAIAVDALGADKVHAVMMPSRYTADISVIDAEQQARALGVHYSVIPIEGMFKATLEALAGEFAGRKPDTTEENIQSRCRMLLLMGISNKTGRMLLTTGNKSEMAVGYATLYGDMAGGFAPIKDCSKMLVYRLSEYRNSLSDAIPRRVIERPPSAELRPDQKDSDSLPEYPVLDAILEAFIEEDLSVGEIVARGFDKASVGRVLDLVKRNEYKRRQAPPGVRVSRRAFGRDWRYPITNGYKR